MDSLKKGYTENTSLESQISLEKIRLLYGGLKFSLPASFAVAAIIYYMLLDHADSRDKLDIWACIMLSMFSLRALDAFKFHYSPPEIQQLPRWKIQFLSGTLIGGVSWGLLAWLGHSSSVEYMATIVMAVVGVCAGSLSSLTFSWKALVIFIAPATILLDINLIMSEGEFSRLTSIILSFFILFTLLSGKRIFNYTSQNIRLRMEADNREVALELLHQKQLLHTKQTTLAVIEFDLELRITQWNKAAEDIFGYQRDEAIGQDILKLLVPESSLNQVENLWATVLDFQLVVGEAIENNTKNGEKIVCEWYITPLTKYDNEIVGIAAMALDITKKKQFEEELVNAKNESERANQAKSDFLSNMSHELRTPLNAILGFTQLLDVETRLDNKQTSYVNEINGAGNLLLELVNQTLDLARIEEGYLDISIEKVSVGDVINECNTLIAPFAEQNDISICTSDIYNHYVNADYTRLKQVLLNLLTNAIKYNHKGGSVQISCNDTPNKTLRISVTDTGKGIPLELQKEIFKPFNRLDVGSTIEGTGIGLSISQQLIEKMDGKIGVESPTGAGSTFWVELDNCVTAVVSDDKSLTNSSRSLQDMDINREKNIAGKILVAEDNPINQTLIINQLNTLGYRADLATNGNEALEKLSKSQYDLLFTDCNMPVMDGYELARNIRNNGDSKLSIIAITADAFPEKEERCLAAGMNGRITKPVSLEILNNTIDEHLS